MVITSKNIIQSSGYFFLRLCTGFIFCTTATLAQDNTAKHSLSLLAGIGNYESVYSGVNVGFSRNHYFEVAVGIKPWNLENELYVMMYADVGIPLFKKEELSVMKIYFQPKVITWYLNNDYNRFLFIAIGPELRVTYNLAHALQVCGSAGLVYNAKLYYERKTYEEVGWPLEYQPSFSLQIAYRLR
ncbi:MAG: hypothetical protein ABIO46_07480 [Chitinophagales bacterium]